MMSLFATTAAETAGGERPSAISSESIDEITLSPKSPAPALCISPEKTTTAKTKLSSPDVWAEVETVDVTGEDESATCTGDALDEVARLRSENNSLMSQVTQLHALLQEHAVLVETAAAEICPSSRDPQPATSYTWWAAATRTFRSVQSDEAVRATEKQAVKTAADATRTAAEAAAEGVADGALAALGHPELASAANRLIDANADVIEDEVVAYADSLIDASAPSTLGTPAMSTDISDVGESDTFSDGEAGSALGTEKHLVAAPALSPSLLPKWSQLMDQPAGHAGWLAVGAIASLAGLYAANRYKTEAASALTTLREKLPAFSSLSHGIGGTSRAGASATVSCAQSNADESLSLAPVLASLGKRAADHVPGEGMLEMAQAGLGESGHSF